MNDRLRYACLDEPCYMAQAVVMTVAIEREYAWRWRDDSLGDVEFLHARYLTHSFAPHTHDGYAFGVVEAGAEAFWYRGATRVALPGQLIALNPDELHTGGSAPHAGGWTYRMIYPAAELVERAAIAAGLPGGTPTFREAVICDEAAALALAHFHRLVELRDGALSEASGLLDVLSLIARRHASACVTEHRSMREDRIAARARDYLDAHFQRNVTLNELAGAAGISPFHLARVFRAALGIPPHRYLEQQRVRHAKLLIRAGVALSFVAAESGFADQSQLTRHFKRHLGVTPGAYRRAVNGDRRPRGSA